MYRSIDDEKRAIREAQEAQSRIRQQSRYDERRYAPGPLPMLTDEEKKAIDDRWQRYSFAYPEIDYDSFAFYKSTLGYVDPGICPTEVRALFIENMQKASSYRPVFQHKCMLPFLYPDIRQPESIVFRMRGCFLDRHYDPIAKEEAIALCAAYLRDKGELVVKQNGGEGGKEVYFIEKDPDLLRSVIEKEMGSHAFVVQAAVKQSAFMERLNPSSVNTIRIITVFSGGSIQPTAAMLRVGEPGGRVDNFSSGGSLIGIDLGSGTCRPYRLDHQLQRHTMVNGIDLAADPLIIPNFEKVKQIVTKMHHRIPYMDFIGWDIALDPENEPLLIECNFNPGTFSVQVVSGPFFGSRSDEIFDHFLRKTFYRTICLQDFVCHEYEDRIVIAEYIGKGGQVSVPVSFQEKRVSYVNAAAFEGYETGGRPVGKVRPGETIELDPILSDKVEGRVICQ